MFILRVDVDVISHTEKQLNLMPLSFSHDTKLTMKLQSVYHEHNKLLSLQLQIT